MMIAVWETDGVRFVIPTIATPNARTEPTISMFRTLLQEWIDDGSRVQPSAARRILVIQYDDRIHHNIGSVAYCRPRDEALAVRLVPDTYFFLSRGYQSLREAAASKVLPAWEERQDIVFWRGSATTNGSAVDGSEIERIEQIPRVALCRMVQGHNMTDVAIMAPWGFSFPEEQQIKYFMKEAIFRPAIAMLHHANYRYLIDIDGVANAWSFFEKMLVGSCILKVGSPFEQWYYCGLSEWQHFVPVRADLSDLLRQIEWCRDHPNRAREIAEEGQRFALAHCFQTARQMASEAICRSLLILDE